MGHGPPLGRPWPLSMQNPEGLSSQTIVEDICFWPASSSVPKTELNWSEDLFFGSSSDRTGKPDWIDSGWKNFHYLKYSSFFCYSQII